MRTVLPLGSYDLVDPMSENKSQRTVSANGQTVNISAFESRRVSVAAALLTQCSSSTLVTVNRITPWLESNAAIDNT